MRASDAFDVRRTLRRELEPVVAANIRRLLRSTGWRGMSETQLGEALGLTQAGISRRFTGLSRWEAEELETVARVLGTSVGRLVTPTE